MYGGFGRRLVGVGTSTQAVQVAVTSSVVRPKVSSDMSGNSASKDTISTAR